VGGDDNSAVPGKATVEVGFHVEFDLDRRNRAFVPCQLDWQVDIQAAISDSLPIILKCVNFSRFSTFL